MTFWFFVCESNISGTAEQICSKFTEKTCLVPRSEEFECRGQSLKVKVTRDKTSFGAPITLQQGRNSAVCCMKRVTMYCQQGPCVRFMYGKTSLALVVVVFLWIDCKVWTLKSINWMNYCGVTFNGAPKIGNAGPRKWMTTFQSSAYDFLLMLNSIHSWLLIYWWRNFSALRTFRSLWTYQLAWS